jgi:hypothetical protein
MILFSIVFKVEGATIFCEGKGELPKFSKQTYFSNKIININKNIIDEWLGFCGTHGLPLF